MVKHIKPPPVFDHNDVLQIRIICHTSSVEMDRQFARITQKAIEISRTVRLGDAENIPDQQTMVEACPVSMSSTGHLLDSSPFKETEVDDSDDSDGSEIFIEQQVESTVNKEPLINSQDELLLYIHDAIPIEPPGESCFVSQLSDEESQEEEDLVRVQLLPMKSTEFQLQISKMIIRLLMDRSSLFFHWFYLHIWRLMQNLWKLLKQMKAS
jgi:hypothetical protein